MDLGLWRWSSETVKAYSVGKTFEQWVALEKTDVSFSESPEVTEETPHPGSCGLAPCLCFSTCVSSVLQLSVAYAQPNAKG